jgi:hypothetical protein
MVCLKISSSCPYVLLLVCLRLNDVVLPKETIFWSLPGQLSCMTNISRARSHPNCPSRLVASYLLRAQQWLLNLYTLKALLIELLDKFLA